MRLWDPVKNKYTTGKSTKTRVKAQAEKIAKDFCRQFTDNGRKMRNKLFCDYLLNYWNWDSSQAIALDKLSNTKGKSEAYVRNTYSVLAKYVPNYFKSKSINVITTKDIRSFVLLLKKEKALSVSSVKHILSAVKQCLRYAYQEGDTSYDVRDMDLSLRNDQKVRDSFTSTEVKKLLNALPKNSVYGAAVKVACYGGLRLGEILALKESSVRGDCLDVGKSYSAVTGIKSTKSGKARQVPLPLAVLEQLKSLVEISITGDQYLFKGKSKQVPISASTMASYMRTAMEEIGIPRTEQKERLLGFHALRHFANTMLRQKVDDRVLRKVIGHQDAAMTNRYDHLMEEDRVVVSQAQEVLFAELSA